jgi:hypothetical protein
MPVSQPWLIWLLALGMLAAIVAARSRRMKLFLPLALLLVLTWGACAGGSQSNVPTGTPAGTFTITINAASHALTHSATVTLTVN